jgi:hypothetical protein
MVYKNKYDFIPLYQMMKHMEKGQKIKVPLEFANKYILVFGDKKKISDDLLKLRDDLIDLIIDLLKHKKLKKNIKESHITYLWLLAFNPIKYIT